MGQSEQSSFKARWLDSLWDELFADGGGILSPRQIRSGQLDRERVRATELATMEATEREMDQLGSGRMLRDVSGQIVDAQAVGAIPMFSIIERPPLDDDALFARVSRPDSVLRSAVDGIEQRELRYALNLRRIAILAEEEISAHAGPVRLSRMRPGSHWMQCWRQQAERAFSPGLQRLWARLLMHEIAAPGRYPLAVVDTLARIGERDLDGVCLLARCSFRDFLFDARRRYFERELHEPLLRMATDLGLLQADAKRFSLLLKPRRNTDSARLLICNNRALQIAHLPAEGLPLPVIRISEVGKQIFRLCDASADTAYLLDMAAYLQQCGAEVAMGDWHARERQFSQRVARV